RSDLGTDAPPYRVPEMERAARAKRGRPVRRCLGSDLLCHPVARAVPSALEGLTAGFGMGPGVPPPLWPPKRGVRSCGVPARSDDGEDAALEQSSGTAIASASK